MPFRSFRTRNTTQNVVSAERTPNGREVLFDNLSAVGALGNSTHGGERTAEIPPGIPLTRTGRRRKLTASGDS